MGFSKCSHICGLQVILANYELFRYAIHYHCLCLFVHSIFLIEPAVFQRICTVKVRLVCTLVWEKFSINIFHQWCDTTKLINT